MKTIRYNTFETNSSSTHAFTIKRAGDNKKMNKPLVEGNVIYPNRLKNSPSFASIGDGWALTCSEEHEKLAQFLIHMEYFLHNKEDDDELESWQTSQIRGYVEGVVFNTYALSIDYENSSTTNSNPFRWHDFSGTDEDCGGYIDKAIMTRNEYELAPGWKTWIDSHFVDVISNPGVITSESEIEN